MQGILHEWWGLSSLSWQRYAWGRKPWPTIFLVIPVILQDIEYQSTMYEPLRGYLLFDLDVDYARDFLSELCTRDRR